MVANLFFRLKCAVLNLMVHIENHTHKCKNRILRSGGFCYNSDSNYAFRCGISRYLSPSCQCSRSRFSAKRHKFMASHFSGTISGQLATVENKLRLLRMKYCINICIKGLNPCQGFGSKSGWIRIPVLLDSDLFGQNQIHWTLSCSKIRRKREP
jgi:hypothetical protein